METGVKGSTYRKEGRRGVWQQAAAVKATQEEISGTPRRPKVEQQHLHSRMGHKLSRLMEISGIFLFPSLALSLHFSD